MLSIINNLSNINMFLILPFLVSFCGALYLANISNKLKKILPLVIQLISLIFVFSLYILFQNNVEFHNVIFFSQNQDNTRIPEQNDFQTIKNKDFVINTNTSNIYSNNTSMDITNNKSIFSIAFFVDKYAMYFACMIVFLWFFASIYTIEYMRLQYKDNVKDVDRFMLYYHLCVSISLFCVFAANIFTMFIFYELLSIFTIPLVCFNKTKIVRKNITIYAMTLIGLSSCLLFPAILIYIDKIGTNYFFDSYYINNILKSQNYSLISILFAMMVFGVAKSAIFPFFSWLPKAMVAPTPVSALLHAVAVVKIGVFVIFRIIDKIFTVQNLSAMSIFGFFQGQWLMYISTFAILISSCYAIIQKDVKKMLAYSTISQLSYVLLALSFFTKEALNVAFLQMVSHAFAKINLFFIAGILYIYKHDQSIDSFNGIVKQNKIIAFSLIISVFSIIGLPFTMGFLVKTEILKLSTNLNAIWIQIVLLFSVVLTSTYLLKLVYKAFFVNPSPKYSYHLYNINPYLTISVLYISIANVLLFFLL